MSAEIDRRIIEEIQGSDGFDGSEILELKEGQSAEERIREILNWGFQ